MAALLAAVLVLILGAAPAPAPAPAAAQDENDFGRLQAGQRVYDRTGSSLTATQREGLQRRLDALPGNADAIVYVRELDADPDDTLDQVEELQQAWVRATGADEDTAVAFLVNRQPGARDEARAGVYAGSTFDDGNVPEGEQEDIVDEALIPPLRDGDVDRSLIAGIDRLGSSIRTGPPQSAFDVWAKDAGGSWLPIVGLGLALLGLALAGVLWGRRARADVTRMPATTSRPGDLSPALGGALVAGSPQASAIPAVVLDLAARGALAIELEKEPGKLSEGRVGVRLRDRGPVRGAIEQQVWHELEQRAADGVVTGKELEDLSGKSGPVREVVREQMREREWLEPGARGRQAWLGVLSAVALVLFVFALAVIAAGPVLMLLAVVPLGALVLLAFVACAAYPRLSAVGLAAAAPWKAYRDGLKAAAKDDERPLDLDAVLPDAIAMELGARLKKRLDAATTEGAGLRAFAGTDAAMVGGVVPWAAFSGSFSSSSGASSTVSGGGAGGGGGAAGST